MERKVDLANQGFDIATTTPSATTTADGISGCANSLNQLPQVVADETARDLHHRERAVPRLGDVADAQDVGVQLLEFLAQLVRWWGLEVGRERVAVGHGRGEEGEEGSDVLRCSVQLSNETSEILDPGCFVWRSCGVVGEVAGTVGDES